MTERKTHKEKDRGEDIERNTHREKDRERELELENFNTQG